MIKKKLNSLKICVSWSDCTLSLLTRLYGMLGLKLRLQGKIFLLEHTTTLPCPSLQTSQNNCRTPLT